MQANKANVKLSTDFDESVQKIMIDPDRLSQVLLNLYLNSIEAMENGGELLVSIKNSTDLKLVTIEITDTGSGIQSKDLAHIFDPYFTTKSSGTGLGLAISYNIIEAHKGNIQIESTFGKGTTITIQLPIIS